MAALFMIQVFSLAAVFIQCQINVFRDINNEQLLTVPNGDFHFSLSFQITNPKGKWAVSTSEKNIHGENTRLAQSGVSRSDMIRIMRTYHHYFLYHDLFYYFNQSPLFALQHDHTGYAIKIVKKLV